MSLAPARASLLTSAQPLHTRTLAIDVFQDEPRLLRAEGEILDLRRTGFVLTGGDLQTAGFIHHMQIHLWVEIGSGTIERLEAFQPHVAFEASNATGGESCRDVVPRLQALVGRSIEDAFHPDLSACFGGPLGCSHLLTLAQAMGSALPPMIERERAPGRCRSPGERIGKRAVFLDGLRAGENAMDLTIQLSDFAMAPQADVVDGLDRLARQREVEARGRVDLGNLTITSLEAAERMRTPDTLDESEWVVRSHELAPLVGGPALSGMARSLFECLRGPDQGLLRDALLQFAPGLIQCFAARTEELLQRAGGGDDAPRILSVGGLPGSCHMWRADGILSLQRTPV